MWKPSIDQKFAALVRKLLDEGLSIAEAAAIARRDLKQRRIEARRPKEVTDAISKQVKR